MSGIRQRWACFKKVGTFSAVKINDADGMFGVECFDCEVRFFRRGRGGRMVLIWDIEREEREIQGLVWASGGEVELLEWGEEVDAEPGRSWA